jgi:DNA-binding protein HU-beta
MNKQDMIEIIAEAGEISKAAAQRTLDALFSNVAGALAKGARVQLSGFGTWETGHRSERTGRNPQTGEAMLIPASTVVKFKAGKALKDQVNVTEKV